MTTELRSTMTQDCKRYSNEEIVALIARIMENGNNAALNISESLLAIEVLESELALRGVN